MKKQENEGFCYFWGLYWQYTAADWYHAQNNFDTNIIETYSKPWKCDAEALLKGIKLTLPGDRSGDS